MEYHNVIFSFCFNSSAVTDVAGVNDIWHGFKARVKTGLKKEFIKRLKTWVVKDLLVSTLY